MARWPGVLDVMHDLFELTLVQIFLITSCETFTGLIGVRS
jgi:hypothetical protein